MEQKFFYITTTLPYVNAEPHIGFAMELVRADIIARYQLALGKEVFFNTGTDEHGQKIFQKASEAGENIKAYVDRLAVKFKELLPLLGIWPGVNFIRTTDAYHIAAAQEFWRRADKAGYIYKKEYETKYCVGCELAKTDSELVDGRCPLHPAQEIDRRAEENYFFKFSEFQDKLLDLYNQEDNLVLPDFRFNEIKNFVKQGLQDFSISRLKEKMSWGVPVPGDDDHVMYVWFDALVNYVSAVGWPADDAKFGRFWPVVQYAGKDNLRQQTAMWQAMLMATSLPASKKIIINGFINAADGQKMSKSLGNTVSPVSLVEDFGTDALRYYIARHISDFEDHDFSLDYFKENYNAHLANGLGNLVSRIMKMASTHLEAPVILPEKSIPDDFKEALDNFRINEATNIIWEQIGVLDQKIQETTPFKLIKTDPATARVIIAELVVGLSIIGRMLEPLLPETAVVIQALVKANKMPSAPLFLRQD